MSKRTGKGGFIFRLVLNVILLIEYVYLLYTVSSSFSFIPWYDPYDGAFFHYIVLWIPLCVTTVVLLCAMFATRRVSRPRVMVLCFNALVVPLTYLLEMTGIGWILTLLRILCVVCVIVYFVVFIKSLKNKTL